MQSKTSGFTTYFRLITYLKRYWWQFLLGMLFTAVASAIAASFTWFLKPLLNEGFINRNILFIKWAPAIAIIAYFALGSAAFLGDYFIAYVSRHIIKVLQRTVFRKYLKLPAHFFDKHTSGELIAKLIYNVEQVAEASTKAILTIFKDAFYFISLIVVMLSNSILLTCIFFTTIPFILLVTFLTGKAMKKLCEDVQDSVSDISHVTAETIDGSEVINNFGGQKYEINKFNKATAIVCNKQILITIINSLGTSTSRIIASIAIASSIFLATSGIDALSAGAFISTIAAMLSILKPLRNLTNVNTTLQKGIAGAQSVFEVLDEENEKDEGIIILQRAAGNIRYDHVSFRYKNAKRNAIDDISFEIKQGEKIAIVGPSGSGKSTLIHMLSRFYDCSNGKILIDNFNIKNVMLPTLRAQFSTVSQRITLFNDTVANNIAYGCFNRASDKDIHNAAEAAFALDFINDLPQGFDTIIGEDGALLSSGQRQRIAIARAILKDAPILILDEATSDLDSKSEDYIQAALKNLMANRTTLVIAHRLSTIKNIDKIIVLDKGKLVEFGTHDQLLANDGIYTKLYRLQFKD